MKVACFIFSHLVHVVHPVALPKNLDLDSRPTCRSVWGPMMARLAHLRWRRLETPLPPGSLVAQFGRAPREEQE